MIINFAGIILLFSGISGVLFRFFEDGYPQVFALNKLLYLAPYLFWIGLGIGLLARRTLAYEISKNVLLFASIIFLLPALVGIINPYSVVPLTIYATLLGTYIILYLVYRHLKQEKIVQAFCREVPLNKFIIGASTFIINIICLALILDSVSFQVVSKLVSHQLKSQVTDVAVQAPAATPSSPAETGTSLPASTTALTSTVAAASAVKDPSQPDIVDTPLRQANSETFVAGETVYVTAPSASVDMNGTVISLPISADAQVKGPAESCSFESDSSEGAVCVFIGEIYGDEIDPGFPDGLASANRFSHMRPNLADLLADYDKTPKENQDIRRELAEKAAALDPWSNEAHKRLIEVLNEGGDVKAIDTEVDTFRRYQEHQPQIAKGEFPTIFHYDGQQIRPFAANVKGVIKEAGPQIASQRGTFFNIYGDHKEGFAVTTQTFSCEPKCPLRIPVRNLGMDGKPTDSKLKGIYAANFSWAERNKTLPAVTSAQKSMLTSMLKETIASYSGKVASAAQEKLKSGEIEIASGQLSEDGRIFLIGSLLIGSASDEHYNDMPYASEFIILEQQIDGSFIKASINVPYFKADYCNISGILRDMDGDGTDEIITYCNSGVEGPYADNLNGILQRVNNQWVKAF